MRDAPISPNCRLSWLQAGKAASSTMPSHLLWRNGDLRKLPQIERKQLLSDLLGENDIELSVLFSEHLVGGGQKMFEHAAKLNWEGIISKRADSPYRSERNENWLKIKAVQNGKFPLALSPAK